MTKTWFYRNYNLPAIWWDQRAWAWSWLNCIFSLVLFLWSCKSKKVKILTSPFWSRVVFFTGFFFLLQSRFSPTRMMKRYFCSLSIGFFKIPIREYFRFSFISIWICCFRVKTWTPGNIIYRLGYLSVSFSICWMNSPPSQTWVLARERSAAPSRKSRKSSQRHL